jgi:hypothetical protein
MAHSKTSAKPQRQSKHPQRWEKDLNPDRLAGQNIGGQNQREQGLRSAADIKELTESLADFTADELAQIPIVAAGRRLRQGAVYLDLRGPASEPFKATGGMTASKDKLYAAKAQTPPEYWNRLEQALRSRGKSGQETADEIPEGTVDKALEDSFPTSDPPAWTTGRERPDPDAPQAPREKRAAPRRK